MRWQIRNGRTVSGLHDKWILALHPATPCYNPRVLAKGGDVRVADFSCPGEGRWSDAKLVQWFHPNTCRAIKVIPLPCQDIEDKLVWHDTCDGIFTVKSAYHLTVLLTSDRVDGYRRLAGSIDKGGSHCGIPPFLLN
ncbi:unnamed protein product [Linum trigynum]|uniref:Uncharacterized protein n=1 Tax=Linum trigynum TaxID=586398 RepID=A0AAV2CLC6_9ROSI